MKTPALLIGSTIFSLVVAASTAHAATTTITYSFDVVLDRLQPDPGRNLKARDEGTLTLNDSGSIADSYVSGAGSASGSRNSGFTAKLGETKGISGWHVVSKNVLERINDYSQNYQIYRITVSGSTCHLTMTNKLKPGFSTYRFTRVTTGEIGYYTNVHVVGTSCSIR